MSSIRDLQNEWLAGFSSPAIKPDNAANNKTLPNQFSVYRSSVKAFHLQALQLAYPILQRVVGDDYFKQLAHYYFTQRQLKSSSLAQYGESFATVLRPLLTERAELTELPYLADLATLEWCRHLSYYAADAIPSTPAKTAQLLAMPTEQLCFKTADSLYIVSSQWPILELFDDQQPATGHIIVYRENFAVSQRYAEPNEVALLQAIFDGQSMAHIEKNFSAAAAQLLPLWMQNSWCRLIEKPI